MPGRLCGRLYVQLPVPQLPERNWVQEHWSFAEQDRRILLVNDECSDLELELEAACEAGKPHVELLLAAAKVVRAERLGCDIEVTGVISATAPDGPGESWAGRHQEVWQLLQLRVDVYLPDALLQDAYQWRCRTPAAALVFSHMAPLLPGGGEGPSYVAEMDREGAAWEPKPDSGDPFTVTSCLLSLPSRMMEQPLPEIREVRSGPAGEGNEAASTHFSLASLPSEVLRRVLHHCEPATLKAAAVTCRHLHALAADVPPGLRLTLHRHQRAALRWMLGREGPTMELQHPCWRRFTVADHGAAVWCNLATGDVSTEPPPRVLDFRGGLLCDDPGLGKTITMLALVVRTVGLLPVAPQGKRVEWFVPGKQGAYFLRQSEAASAATLQRTRSAAGDGCGGLRASSRRSSRSSSLGVLGSDGGAGREGSVGLENSGTGRGAGSEALPGGRYAKRRRTLPNGTSVEGGGRGAVSTAAVAPASEAAAPSATAELGTAAVGSGSAGGAQDGAASQGGGEGGGCGLVWVQCDLCRKWRSITPAHHPQYVAHLGQLPSDAPWSCGQHPDPDMANMGCEAEQEEEDQQLLLAAASGWLGQGELPGSDRNIAHYRHLLRGWDGAGSDLYDRDSVLQWLSQRRPEELSQKFTIARDFCSPAGYGLLLSQLGFQPSAQEQRRQQQAEGGKRSGRCRGGSGALAGLSGRSWEPKPNFRHLRLDTTALGAALNLGPEEVLHRIYLSSATLIVVPAELIPHWLQQISRHVARGTLRVWVHEKDGAAWGYPQVTPAAELPQKLAFNYDVVLTSIKEFSFKWDRFNPIGCNPLMQVHWLRVILDEGQKIGSLTITNKQQMAKLLHAERRWVMTGTPTPTHSGSDSVQAPYLWALLEFLHQQPYGTSSTVWQEGVAAPFAGRKRVGRQRLMEVLARCMIRASKRELWQLPQLIRKVTLLDFAPEHAASYNGFVDIVRFNLLTSDWYDDTNRESLLAECNRQRATQTLGNLRKSCCVSGNCNLQVTPKDLHEALTLLISQPRFQGMVPQPYPLFDPATRQQVPPPYVEDSHPLRRIQQAMLCGGNCDVCAGRVRVLLFTPCACLLCVDCASGDRESCVACGEPYLMQSKDDPARLADNPSPKWDVPQQVIEWQPAYAQRGAKGAAEGEWQPDWQHTKSTKCLHLLRRLREIGATRPRSFWGGIGGALSSSSTGGGLAPPASSVAGTAAGTVAERPQTKAIVFTQFWVHMDLLQRYLLQHLGWPPAVVKGNMMQPEKAEQLQRFQFDKNCSVLLMDETGSVGHDLSFCHFVFLMEPIADKSVEDQVVSRAHRMGVEKDVTVELLVMKGTVEEHMVRRQQQLQQAGGPAAAAEAPSTAAASELQPSSAAASAAANGSGPWVQAEGRTEARGEAAERQQRNALLLSLRPVQVAHLAEYWSDSEAEEGIRRQHGVVEVPSLLPELLAGRQPDGPGAPPPGPAAAPAAAADPAAAGAPQQQPAAEGQWAAGGPEAGPSELSQAANLRPTQQQPQQQEAGGRRRAVRFLLPGDD